MREPHPSSPTNLKRISSGPPPQRPRRTRLPMGSGRRKNSPILCVRQRAWFHAATSPPRDPAERRPTRLAGSLPTDNNGPRLALQVGLKAYRPSPTLSCVLGSARHRIPQAHTASLDADIRAHPRSYPRPVKGRAFREKAEFWAQLDGSVPPRTLHTCRCPPAQRSRSPQTTRPFRRQ